jgi:hypothetical protein
LGFLACLYLQLVPLFRGESLHGPGKIKEKSLRFLHLKASGCASNQLAVSTARIVVRKTFAIKGNQIQAAVEQV